MHLKQQRMKQQLFRAWSLRQIMTEALSYKVLLLAFFETLDRPLNVLGRHHCAGIAIALDLQRRHFQRTHAERVDVDGGRETAFDLVDRHGAVLRRDEVHILDVLPTRLHVMINCIRRYTTNFN